MSETDKTIEGFEGRAIDPSLGYRNWPAPNEVEQKRTSAQTRQFITDRLDDEPLTGKTLLATCGFLIAILLVGFVAGYSVRGSAYAGNTQPALVTSAMVTVPPPQSMVSTVGRGQVVASLGSQAPDELVSFDTHTDGAMTALVRLHDTSIANNDRISFVEIGPGGMSTELFRQEANGSDNLDVVRLEDGRFVSALQEGADVKLTGLSISGEKEWTRSLTAATGHQADISLVSTNKGTAIVGPAEQAGRINAVYLDLNGNLLWHRSFAAATAQPDAALAANPDGSIFLAYRGGEDETGASHTLKRIDENGQDVWTTPFEIGEHGQLSGLASNGRGGLYLLTTGDTPSLTHVGPGGNIAWDVLLPEARLFSDIKLMSDMDGNAIVAISYDLGVERVDVWIEKRGREGVLIGETSMSLPGLSTVDALNETGNDQYLIAGSLLPGRFEDTDIYVKTFEFRSVAPPARVSASLATPSTVVDTLPSTTSPSPEPIQTASIEPQSAPVTSSNEPEVTAVEEVATDDRAPSTEVTTDQAADEAGSAPEVVGETELAEADPSGDEAALVAATSTVRAQCRFSCFEAANTTASFPMWRSIEAPQADFDSGLTAQHELTCKTAGGVVNMSVPPSCQGY